MTYRTGKAVYRSETQRSVEVNKNRRIFARLIGNLIESNRPLIYADETTYNTW